MNNLGDSGFSVFQAGHWLWQRPHSVHEVKSRMPFQAKSSSLPTPRAASSSRSSMFSKSIGPPPALRLNQMLKNAVNRCQATPMFGFSEITIIHVNEMTILSIATRKMTFARALSDSPDSDSPIQNEKG